MKKIFTLLLVMIVYMSAGVGVKAANEITKKPVIQAVDQVGVNVNVEIKSDVIMAKARWFGNEINRSVAIQCPGCNTKHVINIDISRPGPNWQFNKDMDSPTFKPSLLVRTGYYANPDWNPASEDLEWAKENSSVCHSFITNGKIQFLNDCTHHLKGKTVDLPDIAPPPNTDIS